MVEFRGFLEAITGSTMSAPTVTMDKINPKDCQVLSLGDSGFLQFFRVVSSDDKANPVIISTGPLKVTEWRHKRSIRITLDLF